MVDSVGFETFDEMAIRITNSLDHRENFLGITRTNSENEITRRRASLMVVPTLPGSPLWMASSMASGEHKEKEGGKEAVWKQDPSTHATTKTTKTNKAKETFEVVVL